MPAVSRMITEFKGKLDRPELSVLSTVVSPAMSSSDNTLNYSYELAEDEESQSFRPVVPYSDSDSE